MHAPSRITIVTPSFNQGRFIAETIESVAAQDYPDLEHIVMDGGSTDGTLEILKRFPHLVVVSERDGGQGEAINRGFARATGAIWGFLNSDDTLLPGALERVAAEIDPAKGRHVVMGRCRFIDEQGRYSGIEHPSDFGGYRRVLEIWKGYTIPQPAVFWTPEVWRRAGGLDETLKYHLDYDLFIRFARHYRFHLIDQVLATYRLHSESKTEAWSEADRLEDSIALSRRYWGSSLSPFRWRLEASLWWHRFDRVGRARRRYARAKERRRRGASGPAWLDACAAALLAPELAFYRGIYPALRRHAGRAARRLMERLAARRGVYPQTAVYLDRTQAWNDRWCGPRLVLDLEAPDTAREVVVSGEVELHYLDGPLSLAVSVDDAPAGVLPVAASGPFRLRLALARPVGAGGHRVEVRANRWFVPHRLTRGGDYRPLAWRVPEEGEPVELR